MSRDENSRASMANRPRAMWAPVKHRMLPFTNHRASVEKSEELKSRTGNEGQWRMETEV